MTNLNDRQTDRQTLFEQLLYDKLSKLQPAELRRFALDVMQQCFEVLNAK